MFKVDKMLDFIQVFLQAVNGSIKNLPPSHKLSHRTPLSCQCECGRNFYATAGEIMVWGKWCNHTNKLGTETVEKKNIPRRLIFAISYYLMNNCKIYSIDEDYIHCDPNISVIYLPNTKSPDVKQNTNKRQYIYVPFNYLRERGIAETKILIYKSLEGYKFPFGMDVRYDSFKSNYATLNFEIIRAAWDYSAPKRHIDANIHEYMPVVKEVRFDVEKKQTINEKISEAISQPIDVPPTYLKTEGSPPQSESSYSIDEDEPKKSIEDQPLDEIMTSLGIS